MTEVWVTIAALAVINVAIKSTGPLLAGGRTLPRTLDRLIDAAIPALMIALIVTGTLADGQKVVLDARAAGVAAAAVALFARVPLIGVMVIAAGTTALLRAVGS